MADTAVPEEVEKALAILADGAVNNPDGVGIMAGKWLGQDVFVLAVERSVDINDVRVYPVAVMLTAEQWKEVHPPSGLGTLVDDSDSAGV